MEDEEETFYTAERLAGQEQLGIKEEKETLIVEPSEKTESELKPPDKEVCLIDTDALIVTDAIIRTVPPVNTKEMVVEATNIVKGIIYM